MMKYKISAVIYVISLILLFPEITNAKTTFEVTPNPDIMMPGMVQFGDLSGLTDTYTGVANDFFDENEEVLATGMAATNTLGYPIGVSAIRQFPHFHCGAVVGVGAYKYKRYEDFDSDNIEEENKVPGAGFNGGFFFGTGITDKFDIIAKFFSLGWFTSGSYEQTFKTSGDDADDGLERGEVTVKLDDYDIYSFGLKARYQLVERMGYRVFGLGGVSLNMSFDYMRYTARIDVLDYTEFENQDFDLNAGAGSTETQTVNLEGSLSGYLMMNTNIMSFTPEIYAYFDLLYVFSLYTGPSVSFVSGSSAINMECSGNLKTNDALIYDTPLYTSQLVDANTEIASAKLSSKNKMRSAWIIPKWTLGLEITILLVNIHLEAATVLTSPTESFTVQTGISVRM